MPSAIYGGWGLYFRRVNSSVVAVGLYAIATYILPNGNNITLPKARMRSCLDVHRREDVPCVGYLPELPE